MTKVSAVCLQKDMDVTLHALNKFGQFHVETQSSIKPDSYADLRQETDKIYARLVSLIQQLKIDEGRSQSNIFQSEAIERTKISLGSWSSLLQSANQETSDIETEVNQALRAREETDREETELQRQRNSLQLLSRLDIDPRRVTDRLIRSVAARVPMTKTATLGKHLSAFPSVYYYEPIDNDTALAFIATLTSDSQAIDIVLEENQVQLVPMLEIEQSPKEALLKAQQEFEELERTKESAEREVKSISGKYGRRLLALREAVSNLNNVLRIKETALQRGQLTEIMGFVPQTSVRSLEDQLEESLKGRFLLFSGDYGKGEDPPTLLKHSSLVKPFEKVTTLYGLPHYDEIDPTPLMALTFPFIFGLMFGDVGHGIILFAFGLTASFIVKTRESWIALFRVLAACGLGSIIAGLLFGEVFGKQLLTPLWLDPFENITSVLIFALLVGVVHIATGFIVNLANFAVRRQFIDALTVSLVKLVFYVEAVVFLFVCQLNFGLWLSGPIYYLIATLVFLLIGKPAVASLLKKGKFFHVLGERLFEGTELLLMLISNTVSYSRILALLIAHWALLTATYAISGLVAPLPVFGQVAAVIIMVGGNVFVLAFEALIVLVSTLRLHFYEWFSKFYEGTGTQFKPFKYQEKYVEIHFQD